MYLKTSLSMTPPWKRMKSSHRSKDVALKLVNFHNTCTLLTQPKRIKSSNLKICRNCKVTCHSGCLVPDVLSRKSWKKKMKAATRNLHRTRRVRMDSCTPYQVSSVGQASLLNNQISPLILSSPTILPMATMEAGKMRIKIKSQG